MCIDIELFCLLSNCHLTVRDALRSSLSQCLASYKLLLSSSAYCSCFSHLWHSNSIYIGWIVSCKSYVVTVCLCFFFKFKPSVVLCNTCFSSFLAVESARWFWNLSEIRSKFINLQLYCSIVFGRCQRSFEVTADQKVNFFVLFWVQVNDYWVEQKTNCETL